MFAELQTDVVEKASEAVSAAGLNSPSLNVRLDVSGIHWVALPLIHTPGSANNGWSKRLRKRVIFPDPP
ncbi:hypothetical protein C4C32_19185 [Pseudomonas corrugata]|uniref:Uncharacterized protein n=1 Tax=Pseudomonas corrugata TaxID=47879 RepID=A0A8B6ULA8_9PSED|nr:hypothetical protein C4C32_19185 [Pseudomonas corrugata]